jgi:hypothetical protein
LFVESQAGESNALLGSSIGYQELNREKTAARVIGKVV